MAAMTKLSKGYDPEYPLRAMGTAAGDYFDVKGEPRGRWWGFGAEALGLEPGSEVDRTAFRRLIAERVHPGNPEVRLGRDPGKARDRVEHAYQEKLRAEPHATKQRKWELRQEAVREARQGPMYYDLTNSLSKSVSVLYASMGENARAARLAGDQEERKRWSQLLLEFDEMLYAANQESLSYFEREAGYTRSNSHAKRVDGQETGHFDRARLTFAQFLQHTSRDDDIQLHIHNVIAHCAQTITDERWRAGDSWGYNDVYMAVSAIFSLHLEAALTQRWGIEWEPRNCQCPNGKCADPSLCPSNFGCEIKDITREIIECFSTRRESINTQVRAVATDFESEHGRPPSQRELEEIHERAFLSTRKGKPESAIDFDSLHSKWARTLKNTTGLDLAAIGPGLMSGKPARSDDDTDPEALRRGALKAVARCQARKSTWSRYQLIHALGEVLPPEVRRLDPDGMVALLDDLADRTLAGEFGADIVCLEAPELVDVPEPLRRDDGLPVYRRHMGAKYATASQLSTEERLLADAGKRRDPLLEPERAAELLGSDSATLNAQLERKPEAGSEQRTTTGLRLDQAAAVWSALTDRKTSTVLTGPAGAGKTQALAAAALTAQQAGVRHIYATAVSQQARNVLADRLQSMGVKNAAVLNSTQFLDRANRPMDDPQRLHIWPGSLILVDEASMLSTSHAAAIKRLAARTGSKEITAGDQEQLQAVEEGGALGLQARQHGYLQLAEPVRFIHQWERDASLRLRAGDASVVDVYDQQGRVRSGAPEDVIEDAAQHAVTLLADNHDVILMARSHDHVRELSRRVRDELIRLGTVDDGKSVRLAEGQRGSVHDLVINRRNDHQAGLANGDIVRIEAIEGTSQVLVRKAVGRDPNTGEPVFGEEMTRHSLAHFEPAYARTVHAAQGGQGTTGIAVVTGAEDRQWLYPAMTRGTDANIAYVMTSSPRKADPQAGPAPAPELARFDKLQRQHEGLTAEPDDGQAETDYREAAAVLADVVERDGTELSATEYRQQQLANADHLGLLESMWQDAIAKPRTERYQRMLTDALPEEYRGGAAESPKATWLWRTLRAIEAAGLDAREHLQAAIDSRSLAGADDVAAVVNDRLGNRLDPEGLVPQPEGRWSDQVPQVSDPAGQKYLHQLAAAMDGRVDRLGPFVAEQRPAWATEALGAVPEDPEERKAWEAKAGRVEAYRERFWDHPAEPIGPEPRMATPEKRAAWHAAAQALGRPAGDLDLRDRDTGSLWLIRDSYETETAWAPKFVGPELRTARLGAAAEEESRARSMIEARAAEGRGDTQRAERMRTAAKSAETLRDWYAHQVTVLEQEHANYGAWSHHTEGSRRMAVAADAELRRRDPHLKLDALRSAEGQPFTDYEREQLRVRERERVPEQPTVIRAMAESHPAFADKLAERESVRVPDADPEYGDHGPAWPKAAPHERDAVRQPRVPHMSPAPGTSRDKGLEAGQ